MYKFCVYNAVRVLNNKGKKFVWNKMCNIFERVNKRFYATKALVHKPLDPSILSSVIAPTNVHIIPLYQHYFATIEHLLFWKRLYFVIIDIFIQNVTCSGSYKYNTIVIVSFSKSYILKMRSRPTFK